MGKRKLVENAVARSDGSEGTKPEILNQQFKQGDLIWVEIHMSSWWPAQVVDEGRVSAKPKRTSKNELLVRLYGTYEYMYVDASKSNSEFEDMLKRENKTMKEKYQEALKQDMSLMLTKGQSELESSTSKGYDSADVSKVKKQQPELTQECTGKGSDKISTVMKVSTNKEKREGSSKQKRKLEFSKEESEEKKTQPRTSMAETPKSKRQKVTIHADSKNYESSIVRQSPSDASVVKAPANTVVKEAIFENQEEIKARDLEIRKIVREIIFGGITNLPKNLSPKIREDAIEGGTSNLEASRMNSRNAAEKSGLKATYSRKNKSAKQGDGEIKCKNTKNERVKRLKDAVSKVLRTPSSNGSKKSRAEGMTPELASTNLKENSNSKPDKTSGNEDQKKNAEANPEANSPELEAGTPAEVKGTSPPAEEKGLLSERQVRVMQGLALIAPPGSPFCKNGLNI